MRKLLIISMLILGIAVHVFCQKKKVGYDTLSVLEGIRPPILINDFSRKSDIYFNEEVKKNTNHLVIDFGNKNRLLIDYQGDTKYELKQNADSLLQNFWNDYSLIRDTVNKNMVKKITYFSKNKNVNRKAIIDIQYFPQKEVFQFGKEVELVRLKQDTLILVNFDNEATSKLAKSANRVLKTYQNQSFLFNFNSIDDVEDMLETNINQAITETAERAETERKTAKPWKSVYVENDVMSQKIRSKIKGNALFDFLNLHGDLGIGVINGQLQNSITFAMDFASSSFYNKGLALGVQTNLMLNKQTDFYFKNNPTYFTGITFYKKENTKTQFKGGIFLGLKNESKYTISTPSKSGVLVDRTTNIKLFGWYQITPLIRLQPELNFLQFKKTYSDALLNPYSQKQTVIGSNIGLRLSFGF